MSYSVTVELHPHADPAKTISVLCRNAAGQESQMAILHETRPKATISVPPGYILVLSDNGGEAPETVYPKRPDWAVR